MPRKPIGEISFAQVYPMYLAKIERKDRTEAELIDVIGWLTGYDAAGLRRQVERDANFERFFADAPAYNPMAGAITGVICGYRVEEIEDPLTRKVRQLDKIVDELAKGKPLAKIKRK